MSSFPCLVRFVSGSGQVRYRLGDRLRRLGPVTAKTLAFPGPTGSSASPLELISGPIVPGPQHEETPWHYVTVSPPALLGARDFLNSETGAAEAGKAQVLGLDGLERPQGTLGLFIISQSAKPWKASFRLVTWVICSRSRGSGR